MVSPYTSSLENKNRNPNPGQLTSGSVGTCEIVLELSGPSSNRFKYWNTPADEPRNMATWVIDNCLRERGQGGYVTGNLEPLLEYVEIPTMEPDPRVREYRTSLPPLLPFLLP